MVSQNVTFSIDDDSRAHALNSLRRLLLRRPIAEKLAERWVVHERKLLCCSCALGRTNCHDRARNPAPEVGIRLLPSRHTGNRRGLRWLGRSQTQHFVLPAARSK